MGQVWRGLLGVNFEYIMLSLRCLLDMEARQTHLGVGMHDGCGAAHRGLPVSIPIHRVLWSSPQPLELGGDKLSKVQRVP